VSQHWRGNPFSGKMSGYMRLSGNTDCHTHPRRVRNDKNRLCLQADLPLQGRHFIFKRFFLFALFVPITSVIFRRAMWLPHIGNYASVVEHSAPPIVPKQHTVKYKKPHT